MSTLADYSVACKAWYSEGLANLSDVENLHVFRIKDNEQDSNSQALGDISMKEAIAGDFITRIPAEEADAWIAAHGSRNIGRGNIVRVSNNNVLAEIFNNDEDSEETASTFVLVKKIVESETVSWRPLACAHLSMDLYHGKPRYVSFTFIGTNKFMRVEFDPNASALYHDLHKFFENRELFTITLGAYKGDESWIRNSLECTEFYKVKLYGSAVNGKGDNDEDMGAPDENNPECRLSIGGDFDESGYTHVMLEAVGVTGKNGILCHQGKEMRCICPVVGGKLVNVDLTEVLYQWVQTAPEEGDPAVANAPDVVIIRGYGMRVVSGSGNNDGGDDSGDDSGLIDITYGWVTGQTNLLGDDPYLFGADGIDGRLHSTTDFIAKGYLKRDPSISDSQDALTSKTDESNSLEHSDSIKICACNKERTKFLVKKDDTFYFLDDDAVDYKDGNIPDDANEISADDTLYEHVFVKAPDVTGSDVTLEICNMKSDSDNSWLQNHISNRTNFQLFNCEYSKLSLKSEEPEQGGIIEGGSYGTSGYFDPHTLDPSAIVGRYRRGEDVIGYIVHKGTKYHVISSKAFNPEIFSDTENGDYIDLSEKFGDYSYGIDPDNFTDEGILRTFIVPMLRRYADNDFSVNLNPNMETSTYGVFKNGKHVVDSIGQTNFHPGGNIAPDLGVLLRVPDLDNTSSSENYNIDDNATCDVIAILSNVKRYDGDKFNVMVVRVENPASEEPEPSGEPATASASASASETGGGSVQQSVFVCLFAEAVGTPEP